MKKKLFALLALVCMTLTASADAVPTYSLTKAEGAEAHGTITFKVDGVAADKAAEGKTVTVEIAPAEGWVVNEPSGQWYAAVAATRNHVVAQGGSIDLLNAIELTPVEGQDNQWTFIMERANAEIGATYKKVIQASWIADITAPTYSGVAQTPTVSVKDGTTTLVKDVDYTVSYSNNTNAALATTTENAPTVTITAVATSEKYAGEATKTFTIEKAELASATLVSATLVYDTFNHQPLTAEVSEVKAGEDGSVSVPTEDYTVEGNTATDKGTYTVTAKADSKNFTGSTTVDFSIVDEVLLVDNDNVPVIVTADPETNTLTIDKIMQPKSGTVVHIPATINGFEVTKIATGALDLEVTDIYMPDTEEPILVEAGAFPATAVIHTTLALLDDYALMSGLQPNYEATKVMTTVTPKNAKWTFSSGVDVLLPVGVTPNRVELIDKNSVGTVMLTDEQLDMNGEKVLKACNGLLMTSTAGQSYDIMAHPGRQASGSAISTDDAKDYGTNLLIPVIVPTHFELGDIYVMKDNKFRGIDDTDTKVPACKAVLKAPAGVSLARVLNIISDTTGMKAIDNGQLTIGMT